MASAALSCRCGKVKGHVADAAPDRVNHLVCYCDDCQIFAHALGRADILDAQGGTEIIQVAPARLVFESGHDEIGGLRLTDRGLFRFHSRCCRTPLGNMVGPSIAFIGIARSSFGADAELPFGPITHRINGKFAMGSPPPGSAGFPLAFLARAVPKSLGWRFGGHVWPHPFFEPGKKEPRYPVTVLEKSELDRLRALAGPKPG